MWVIEGNVELTKTDEHQSAAVRNVFERFLHRFLVSGAVKNRRCEFFRADFLKLRQDVVARVNDVFDSELLLAESQPWLRNIGNNHGGASYFGELNRGKPDWTGADNKGPFSTFEFGTTYTMTSDAKRLYKGKLFE
jgi:hypothetical protein